MEYSLISSIKLLVNEVRKEILLLLLSSSQDIDLVVDYPIISAYDIAWLALIPEPITCHTRPMFKSCLEWILSNQNQGGFWGSDHLYRDIDQEELPPIHLLPTTLACMAALKTWNMGELNIQKGLAFLLLKAEINQYHQLPPWFYVVFPATIELCKAVGLEVGFPPGSQDVLSDILFKRQQIFQRWENQAEKLVFPTTILAYAECLPCTLANEEVIIDNLSKDGSLFHSPSATSFAYLANGHLQCLEYLKNLVPCCSRGVRYPPAMDEELVKLSVVDHIQRLGLGEHFCKDIHHILKEVYRNQNINQELHPIPTQDLPAKLYKDSLAFRLLRMHGYNVQPCSFSWFLYNEELLDYIEKNYEYLIGVLYNVYRATDLMFKGEYQLERARSYSKKILDKWITADDVFKTSSFHKVVEHDLSLPWITRLDHLDHRMWIEQNITSTPQSMGKEYLYRLPCIRNDKLMRLASNNFEFRQSIYAHEMKELERWLEESGLKAIGFGREKSAYCYFTSAASSCFPHDSMARLIIAKTAILITVADDFYDMEGSLTELETLTEAIQRWDGTKLRGHGKAIFSALDDFVRDTVAKCLHQETDKLTTMFKDIWKEIFGAWMVERSWSKSGNLPSMEEYLNTGMISIGVLTILLMVYPSLNPSLPTENIKDIQYHNITKLLMLAARLLNDTQSYQKEVKDGKINYVLLHKRQNPDGEMEDSVEYVKNMLAEKTKEFVEYVVLMDEDDMPRSLRQLQLSCMKVFYMFYNSTNAYDSEAGLVNDMINKAFYVPLQSQKTRNINVPNYQTSNIVVNIGTTSTNPRKKNMVIRRTCVKFHQNIIKHQGGLGIKGSAEKFISGIGIGTGTPLFL